MKFKDLSNEQLFLQAKENVKKETAATLEVLHTLREIERRRAFADKSYPSLFEFCVNYLGYKRGAAYRRILAMRAIKDLPEIETKIKNGSLSLMTVAQAQGYFKQRAHQKTPLLVKEKREIIKVLENKSARETEKFFLKIQPSEPKREVLRPLNNENFEWRTTLPLRIKEKLEEYRALLGPEGNSLEYIEVLEKALEVAILKAKPASNSKIKPGTNGGSAARKGSTTLKKVPTLGKMKRLWMRDHAQCTFVDPRTKERCPQKTHLEVDHIKPRALGGDSSIENLRLLCKAHNQRAAIRVFGLQKMERYLSGLNTEKGR